LQTSFKRTKQQSAEPTRKELEKDAHALIHGMKDGKIEIENVSPKIIAGVHKVKDETFKGKAAFKDNEQGEIKE
jgi:hypothetical protein